MKIEESYNKCIRLLHKKRKTVPYKELDECLHVVEMYMEIQRIIGGTE